MNVFMRAGQLMALTLLLTAVGALLFAGLWIVAFGLI